MSLFMLGVLSLAWSLPSATEVLQQTDKNMNYENRSATIKMTVQKRRRTKHYKMQSHGRGKHDSAIEFQAPAREKGTKMLKKNNELWMYLPSIEKIQKISGHMLRQGMMGSDMSYEDMLEATRFSDLYVAKSLTEQEFKGRRCYLIDLQAKDKSITYARRLSWIDAEHMVPVKEQLFSVSGKLLKEWLMSNIKDFNGRKFPTTIVVQDKLQQASTTTIEFTELVFESKTDPSIFSKRWLER